jgi:hypothetical protein
VSITDRDRKIMFVILPVLLLAAYWFLLFAPKREEASTAAQELATQEQRLADAQLRAASLTDARTDFAADYAELVRIGKAVPTAVDMPTILVQLDDAARGTDIKFTRVTAQEREAAAPAPVAEPDQPADAGGEPAQSGPGQAAESAGDATATANSAGVDSEDAQTSQPASDGSLPVGGGAAAATTSATPGAPVPGLESVGVELEFTGNFLDLSDFFHRIKRYVEVDGDRLAVRGRLVTVDGISFASEPELFPRIRATLTATAYLAPELQGATAGATPSGPSTLPASTGASPPMAAVTPTGTP